MSQRNRNSRQISLTKVTSKDSRTCVTSLPDMNRRLAPIRNSIGREEEEKEEEAILQKRRERSLSQRDQDAAKAMRRITRVPETIKRNFKSLILNT